MTEPTIFVTITLKEIYDAVLSTSGKLDVLIEQQRHTNEELQETQRDLREVKKDFEDRLRALERNRWPIPLVTILLSTGALAVSVVMLIKAFS